LATVISAEDHAQGPINAAITLVPYGDYECEYLFEHQKAPENADLSRYAVALGLDPERFARDRTSPEVAHRIDRDLASGEQGGVPATTALNVNGIRHEAVFDVVSLRSARVAHIDGRAKAHESHA